MPKTDMTALLHSLHNAGKDSDTGTQDDQDDQQERIELRQKAAGVGLVVTAATDAEMLRPCPHILFGTPTTGKGTPMKKKMGLPI